MDTRADFQRLLEDMDKVIQAKRQELLELDERLESARNELSEREAQELRTEAQNLNQEYGSPASKRRSSKQVEELIEEQRRVYEEQLAQLGEELSELDSINQQLSRENNQLKQELNSARTTVEKIRAKSLILSEMLEEVKSANLNLNLRLAKAESESAMQQRLLKKSSDQDELLLNAFNDKLESMKKAIEYRDEEIRQLRSDNQFALETLGIAVDDDTTIDGSADKSTQQQRLSRGVEFVGGLIDSNCKRGIIKIASTLRDRDKLIETLKSQLQEATRELENNANLLEKLSKFQSDGNGAYSSSSFSFEKRLTMEELVGKCEMLESELEHKDKQLHLVEFRNRHFETLLPNVIIDLMNNLTKSELIKSPETLDKIENLARKLSELFEVVDSTQRLLNSNEQLQRTLNEKDAQIERLVNDLNQLDAKYNNNHAQGVNASDQTDAPSETRGNKSDSGTIRSTNESLIGENQALSTSQGQVTIEFQEAKKLNGREVDEHGDQSIRTDLASNPDNQGESSAHSGPVELSESINLNLTRSDSESTQAVKRDVEERKGESESEVEASIKRVVTEEGETKGLPSYATIRSKSILRQARQSVASNGGIDHYVLDLQSRLRQMESENRLLESAMKEILLSIRWSDSQCSTILIDCPSLERLCQLIEARFISSATRNATPKTKSVKFSSDFDKDKSIAGTSSSSKEINAPELFQMIVLKSELDLMRGQNEQLRVDIKTQRLEYQKLLSEYRESFLNFQNSKDEQGGQRQSDIEAKAETAGESTDIATTVASEVECQTDKDIETDSKVACQNCSRLTSITNHLLECIARIEKRVNSSDKTYLNQLVNLYELTKRLERELSICEGSLSDSRREYHSLREQKMMTQSRLDFIENQMVVHLRICPLYRITGTSSAIDGANLEIIASRKGTGVDYLNQSLAIRNDSYQGDSTTQVNSRVTINLLRSIIGCLQARLDYKDERIHHLESLLSSRSNNLSQDPETVFDSCDLIEVH